MYPVLIKSTSMLLNWSFSSRFLKVETYSCSRNNRQQGVCLPMTKTTHDLQIVKHTLNYAQ